MRLVLAQCSVDYVGRLEAHLPMAARLILLKADGSVSIHADDRAYKPLNWMTPPCKTVIIDLTDSDSWPEELPPTVTREKLSTLEDEGMQQFWVVTNSKKEQLQITLEEIYSDFEKELGQDPGLQKDGVEAHLQQLLSEQIELLGEGYTLVRREYPTAIGPVDILSRDADGKSVAVEVKRRGGIDGVEQLSRYLEMLNRDELIAPVVGIFAAQEIKPQARTLAEDRGIRCVILDYAQMRGTESPDLTLF